MKISRFTALPPVGLLCLALHSGILRADEAPDPGRVIPASDPAFRYDGRFDRSVPDSPVVVWEASRISVDFEGTRLVLRFGHAGWQDYFDVLVDGESRVVAVDTGEKALIPWPGKLGPGRHHLELFKRSEASAGSVAFQGIEIGAGAQAWRPAEAPAALKMMFLGDSITVGACDEDGAADQWESRRTHNAAFSYAALTAREFRADYENLSVSGMGIVTGYVDVVLADTWDRLYPAKDSAPADLSSWKPDVVFFILGENDASYSTKIKKPFPANFADRYVDVVGRVRAAYPGAWLVILLGGMGDSRNPDLIAAWTDAVRRLQAVDKRVSHFAFTHWSVLHPRVADHRQLAAELIGWLRVQPFMRDRAMADQAPFSGGQQPHRLRPFPAILW